MEKIKHNHCLTDILKVSLFSLLMLAPLLASVSQMLYVTLNKNAKDSYYGETINQSELIKTTQFNSGNTYILKSTSGVNALSGSVDFICNVESYYRESNNTIYNFESGFFYYNGGQSQNYCALRTTNNTMFYVAMNSVVEFKIIDFTTTSTRVNEIVPYLYEMQYNKYSYLDNAFYYGVDQMTKSDLFNWTQNTGIYTGVHAMTRGIGIESQFIPMLLTYWLVLTIVYIIIDVVIETFKYLTHMLQNKVKSKTS